jgi:hypothetical protein
MKLGCRDLLVKVGPWVAGAMIWSLLDCRHGWRLYLQFMVYGYGVLGSRISTALLALSLFLQARGQCVINKYRSHTY